MALSVKDPEHRFPKTYGELFIHKSPKLKKLDEEECMKFLAGVAAKMIGSMFAVDNVIGAEGFRIWAEMVYEKYDDLRICEIKEIFKKAVKTENYNRIDVQVMFGWAKDYYEEREKDVSVVRENYHRNLKNKLDEPIKVEVPEEFKERTQELVKKLQTSDSKKLPKQFVPTKKNENDPNISARMKVIESQGESLKRNEAELNDKA